MSDQRMLSVFGGGDTSRLDLRLPEGYAPEERDRVEEYAEEIACGGWEFVGLTDKQIAFEGEDGSLYRLIRKDHGWVGSRASKVVRPVGYMDLQEALDSASEYMRTHPAEWVAEVDQ